MTVKQIKKKTKKIAEVFCAVLIAAVMICTAACLAGCSEEQYEGIDLPEGFPELEAEGESSVSGEYYTQSNGPAGYYLLRLNEKGQVVWYKKNGEENSEKNGEISNFRPVKSKSSKVGSFYFERAGTPSSPEAYSELVMLDGEYEEVNRVRYKLGDEKLAIDNHDAIVLDMEHYIICSSREEGVDNLPKDTEPNDVKSARAVYIQEVKDGKVKWQFKSTDYAEFYRYRIDKKSELDHFSEDYTDYMHFNAMAIDPNDGNLLVSFRNQCSIVKLNRKTGDVMWIMGGKGDEFHLDDELTFVCQHAISFTEEGNLLMYDNRIEGENSRILEMQFDEDKRAVRLMRQISIDADTTGWGYVKKLDKNTYLVDEGQTPDPDRESGFYEIDAETGEKAITVTHKNKNWSYWVSK